MSPDFEAFDRDSQAYVEKYFWPLISKAGQFVRRERCLCFVADSTAIRAHVKLARDVGDIDLVFPPLCDRSWTLKMAVQALTPMHREVTKSSEGNVLFARLKLPLDIAYRQERAFLVDLHFGGLVHRGNYVWRPRSAAVFEEVQWIPVSDLSGQSTAELPVLPLPQVIALKLDKDIGRDEIDVLAGLTAGELEIPAIRSAVHDQRKAARVVSRLLGDFDNAFERFCFCYGPDGETHKDTVKERLMNLQAVFGDGL